MRSYRPWGHVDWVMQRLGSNGWSLLSTAGTEARSTSLATYLGRSTLEYARVLFIQDPEPLDRGKVQEILETRASELKASDFVAEDMKHTMLLEGIDEIRAHVAALAESGATRLLVDITSLPKYWFFPLLQSVLEDHRFVDVVATYTSAGKYAEVLSENFGPLRALPGFYADDGRTDHDSIIVGIGFDPSPLLPLLQEHSARKIRLIFPFPPGPPGHRRNWMFVKQIEALTQSEEIEPPDRVHIHMYDCPQVFDALLEMTGNGTETSVLAPYGPKTVSLAMCLFSIAAAGGNRPRVPVFYAQPMRYAVDYTTGVQLRGDVPDTTAYCLRLAGRDLYTLD